MTLAPSPSSDWKSILLRNRSCLPLACRHVILHVSRECRLQRFPRYAGAPNRALAESSIVSGTFIRHNGELLVSNRPASSQVGEATSKRSRCIPISQRRHRGSSKVLSVYPAYPPVAGRCPVGEI